MHWSVARRHELISLLERELASPPRFEALSLAAGLPAPPARGVEPPSCRLSRLVRIAEAAGRIDELAEAAQGMVSDPTADLIGELLVDPVAETIWSEPETVRAEPPPPVAEEPAETDETIITGEEIETIVDGMSAPPPPRPAGPDQLPAPDPPRWAVPRPPGTPAQAPPTEGARSWLIRRVNLGLPSQIGAGEAIELRLTLALAAPGTVPSAPSIAVPWAGPPVAVEAELWLQEAWPAEGTEPVTRIEVDPAAAKVETLFRLVAAEPLSEGVDVAVRFYLAGYEVGRGRAFVPNRERPEADQPAGAPGALVIPDTILPG
jgi:hypothetical protein